MKTSISLTILALSLTLSNCSNKKETVVEETQEQIQKRLDKEKAENLILGTWKLHYIQSQWRLVADSIGINRTITFTKEGIALMNHKDATEQYHLEFKYRYDYLEVRGGKRYIFSADNGYDILTIRDVEPDELNAISTKVVNNLTYIKVRQ